MRRRRRLWWWLSRWGPAVLLDRLPWTCWSSLVDWAMDRDSAGRWLGRVEGKRRPWDERHRIRHVFDGYRCKAERDDPKLGCCYCGKFRREVPS